MYESYAHEINWRLSLYLSEAKKNMKYVA
jgi:hypothetical protein